MKMGKKRTIATITVSALLAAAAIAVPVGLNNWSLVPHEQAASASDSQNSGASLANAGFASSVAQVNQAVVADGADNEASGQQVVTPLPSIFSPVVSIYWKEPFVLPVPSAEAFASHYKLKSDVPDLFITKRAAEASYAPAVGRKGSLADVDNYAVGTGFRVVYTFTPESSSYVGADYNYTYFYEIVPKMALEPAAAVNGKLPDEQFEYGSLASGVHPAAPVFAGFVGSYQSAKVTLAGPGYKKDELPVGTEVDWSKANELKAGTQFVVTFSYVSAPGYLNAPFTVQQNYSVAKKKVDVPADKVFVRALYYKQGSQASQLPVPKSVNPALFEQKQVVFVADNGSAAQTISSSDVALLSSGSKFQMETTFGLKDVQNYEPSSGNSSGTYKVVRAYVVADNVASYSGALRYAPVKVSYNTDAPVDFAQTLLPEPAKASNYALSYVRYRVVKASNDGVTKTGLLAGGLSAVKTLHPGAKLAAIHVFVPTAGSVGRKVEAVKVLSVAPADTSFVYEFTGRSRSWNANDDSNKLSLSQWNGRKWVNLPVTSDMLLSYSPSSLTKDQFLYLLNAGGPAVTVDKNFSFKIAVPANRSGQISLRVNGYSKANRRLIGQLKVIGQQSGLSYSYNWLGISNRNGPYNWTITFWNVSETSVVNKG